ncbi:MAG: amidohydrolase family protein [Bryobacteraceae bacterium]|nr:amidohydrolase family protein [Bryobacteraceae bacterium]
MRIDAQQHFLDHARFRYAGLPPAPSPLDHNYLPEHIARILKRNRFDGLVAVAGTESVEETRWLLEVGSGSEIVMGVAGWVDLDAPDLEKTLDGLQRDSKLRAIRHRLPGQPANAAMRAIARRGLAYDLRCEATELALVGRIADALPELRIAIDRLGSPPLRGGDSDGWAREMALLAARPGIYVKLSGFLTLANPPPVATELRPYLLHLLSAFGADRLMFGSEWPFCLLAADLWKATLSVFTQAIGAQTMETRSKLLGEAAQQCYLL